MSHVAASAQNPLRFNGSSKMMTEDEKEARSSHAQIGLQQKHKVLLEEWASNMIRLIHNYSGRGYR